MSHTLHLTLKRKWFDMIASGEKTEEYREIKPYWEKRLEKDYEYIEFRNGYGKSVPVCMCKLHHIDIDRGKSEWGAPKYPVFVLAIELLWFDYKERK